MAKQKIEVIPDPTPRIQALVDDPNATAVVAVAGHVIDEKPGTVSTVDKIKKYYHTLFYAVGGLLVIIVGIAPQLDPALALLSPKARAVFSVVVLLSGTLLTKFKSNELWVNKTPE